MKLRISKVHEQAASRPAGYVADVLSRGVVNGEWLEISEMEHAALREKYRSAQDPPLPPMPEMAANYLTAQARDILHGRPRRTPEECTAILKEHCEGNGTPCPHFRTDRRCSFCGCPVADKIPLAREHCPIGKW
jgi:hypothetical protein